MWLKGLHLYTVYSIIICYVAAQMDYQLPDAASSNGTENFSLNYTVCTTTNDCYYIYNFTVPTNKYLADIHCQERNQTLGTIDKNIQGKLQSNIDSAAWTGLYVQSTVPNFTWSTADGFVQMSDEPELQSSIENAQIGSCLLVNHKSLWRAQCTHRMAFICEYSREPPPFACAYLRAQLDGKWLCSDADRGSEGRRPDKKIYVDAQKVCIARGGNVVIVDSKEKLDNLTSLLRSENLARPRDVESYSHFWTAGSESKLVWTEKDLSLNAYSLVWSTRDYNPNIDETMRGEYDQCIALARSGLDFRSCRENKLSQVICSTRAPLKPSTNPPLTITITSPGAPQDNVTVDSTSDEANGEAYQTIIICSYVLAGLFALGLVLLIIILVRRRKQRSRLLNISGKNGTLGNGSLGRQRSTVPSVEWEKILNDSESQPILDEETRNGSIDIIHNVPLDPRGEQEVPLNIPRDTEYMTLSQSRKSGSRCSSSLSSEPQSSFTDRSRLRNSPSDSSLAPPLPPKSATLTRTLPPRIPDQPAFDDSCDVMTIDETDLPPPPDLLLHDDNKPALPPKPAQKPSSKKHKKKRHAPSQPTNDIYAKVNKHKAANYLPTHQTLPPPPPQLSPLSDTGDSGIDDNLIHSPGNKKRDTHKTPSEEIAFLDSIIASF